MSGQQPNHADHDLRTGRLINPEGYQVYFPITSMFIDILPFLDLDS